MSKNVICWEFEPLVIDALVKSTLGVNAGGSYSRHSQRGGKSINRCSIWYYTHIGVEAKLIKKKKKKAEVNKSITEVWKAAEYTNLSFYRMYDTVVFPQQLGQAVYVIQYFSSIKLFADMNMGAHFTHQLLLTVNPGEWLLTGDDGSYAPCDILLVLIYIQTNKSHERLKMKLSANAGPFYVCLTPDFCLVGSELLQSFGSFCPVIKKTFKFACDVLYGYRIMCHFWISHKWYHSTSSRCGNAHPQYHQVTVCC